MEPRDIIALLNDDVTAEVEAALVYMNHHFVVPMAKTQLAMLETALEEMHHIQQLAETIVNLGGQPELTPRQLRFNGTDVAEALAHGKVLETEAIEQYRAHIALIDDPAIQRMLTRIMEEEELHFAEFAEVLETVEAERATTQPTVGDLTTQSE
jgi:bacterioferritin